jgi:hypothetical protein
MIQEKYIHTPEGELQADDPWYVEGTRALQIATAPGRASNYGVIVTKDALNRKRKAPGGSFRGVRVYNILKNPYTMGGVQIFAKEDYRIVSPGDDGYFEIKERY